MFLNSLSSFVVDTLIDKKNIKYKIFNIRKTDIASEVVCEVIDSGKEVVFSLEDIVNCNKLQYFGSHDISRILKEYENPSSERKEKAKLKYYYPLGLLFIMCLIISNFGATKLVNFFGFTAPGGIILFPILYVLNDTLTEVYGFRASRRVIWSALLCNLFVSLILYTISLLPPALHWSNHEAFHKIFSLSPIIFIASVSSYLIGESVNAAIIAKLKIAMRGKMFAVRAIFSTLIGASLETVIFCFLAFYQTIDDFHLIMMIVHMVVIKVTYEVVVMPITIKVIGYLKRNDEVDVFEAPSFSELLPGIWQK